MTIHAYETDNGPAGMSWELWDETIPDDTAWLASLATRGEAENAGATVFHTYAEWEAEQEAEERVRVGTETENQGPSGLLVSVLRERGQGGRY